MLRGWGLIVGNVLAFSSNMKGTQREGGLIFTYSPNSSSPKPKMCPTSVEPQEPAEPRHRDFSCHCSSLADVERVDFWRVRRLLAQTRQSDRVFSQNPPL